MRSTDADTETPAAASAIRAEIRRVRTSLSRIEEAIGRLSSPPVRSAVERERPERYYRVLIGVYELGGRHGIAADELGAVAVSTGTTAAVWAASLPVPGHRFRPSTAVCG